ncbi:MAG TPA: GHMP kinase [Candidatus Thermoplasmatota archaeon]|nr:GHMP kinase [Candidatus Thermoplasmatota archaeon]
MSEVQEAAAFSPGHITAFFEIHDSHPDPARRGSRGAGLSVDLGAVSHVRVLRSDEPGIAIMINEEAAEAPVTERAIRALVGRSAVRVEVRTQLHLPVSQGFGMSAAGALSAALALAKALRLPKSDAVIAAHKAEVESATGLGDVVAAVQGGVEIRREPGLPPWGYVERVVGEGELVLCVLEGPLETRAVLGDAEARKRIQKAGKAALVAFSERPTLPNLFRVGKQFSLDSGLATEKVLRAIRAAELAEGLASQSMLGHSVFAYGTKLDELEAALKKHGQTWRARVEPTGARVLAIERAGEPPSGSPSTP